MRTTNTDQRTIILLDESASATVTLLPQDKDKFCMSVEEVISGCQLVGKVYSFVQQVGDLRDLLAVWIEEREGVIHAAYLSFRSDSSILFVIVQKNAERDNQLVDDLTTIDIQIAEDDEFDLLNVDVLSVPRASENATAAFLSSGKVQQYAGQDRP